MILGLLVEGMFTADTISHIDRGAYRYSSA
jgi:hypothetical protein